jgi:serine/threonine protein phosphatase PrpC
MKLVHTIVSETGLRRSNNEDAVLFTTPEKPWIEQCLGTLAIVSDGIGGYEKGEMASAMVVDTLSKFYFMEAGQPADRLREAAIKANNTVAIEGMASSIKMGATCTAVAILEDELYFLHVGDSRAYILRNNELEQVTLDHTLANEMAGSASVRHSEQTMLFNPNALTRAMGVEATKGCHADIFSVKNTLMKGDKILLCSDGVHGHINDQELAVILQQKKSLKEITDEMVKLILKRGATDNFSFIIIGYE